MFPSHSVSQQPSVALMHPYPSRLTHRCSRSCSQSHCPHLYSWLLFRQEIEFVPQKSGIFTNFLFFQKVKDLTFLKNVKVFQKLRKKVGLLYKLMTTILSSNKEKQECRKLNNSVPLFFLGQKWDFGTKIIEKHENQTKIINSLYPAKVRPLLTTLSHSLSHKIVPKKVGQSRRKKVTKIRWLASHIPSCIPFCLSLLPHYSCPNFFLKRWKNSLFRRCFKFPVEKSVKSHGFQEAKSVTSHVFQRYSCGCHHYYTAFKYERRHNGSL